MYQRKTLLAMNPLQRQAAEQVNVLELAARRQKKLVEALATYDEAVDHSDGCPHAIWDGEDIDEEAAKAGSRRDRDPHVSF